jgi:hypothetical protein
MKKLWVWDNGDYCVLEDGRIPADVNGEFVDDEEKMGKLWMELVENQDPDRRRFILSEFGPTRVLDDGSTPTD